MAPIIGYIKSFNIVNHSNSYLFCSPNAACIHLSKKKYTNELTQIDILIDINCRHIWSLIYIYFCRHQRCRIFVSKKGYLLSNHLLQNHFSNLKQTRSIKYTTGYNFHLLSLFICSISKACVL
jgi:hypothetical protein